MIKQAMEIQAWDENLWGHCRTIVEAYIQQSLRDLHSVIEYADEAALKRIKDRLE